MIVDGLDYRKTVDSNKLVFKGQQYQKITSYIFIAISIVLGFVLNYNIIESQLSHDPTMMDYLVVFIFPLIITLIVAAECYNLLTMDKLKEIAPSVHANLTKEKLIISARNLNWETRVVNDNYLVFTTKFGFVTDCQTVTVVIFPDKKIYFNSLNSPNDYIRPARFLNNYNALVNEYLKIEKE